MNEISKTQARRERPSGDHERKRGGWLADPRKERPGEKIGGGFFVFRRGEGTKRVRAANWPFEYPSLEAAQEGRDRLVGKFPGERFIIMKEIEG